MKIVRTTNGSWWLSWGLVLPLVVLGCQFLSSPSWAQDKPSSTLSMAQHGFIGVGTYATVAQFRDLDVTAGDHVLFHKTLAEGVADFDLSGGGQWKVVDNTLQQSSTDAKGMNIFIGDKEWTDYVVSVKARKVTGKEGFSLGFRALDNKNFACLNVGGWSNTKAQFGITVNGTFSEIGDSTNIKVEEDRWYEVKVDVQGDQAVGYVDGKKVATAKLAAPPPKPANPAPARGNPTPRGNPAPVNYSPQAYYNPPAEPSSLWDKVLLAGSVSVITALVVAGAMWLRGRLPKESA